MVTLTPTLGQLKDKTTLSFADGMPGYTVGYSTIIEF